MTHNLNGHLNDENKLYFSHSIPGETFFYDKKYKILYLFLVLDMNMYSNDHLKASVGI